MYKYILPYIWLRDKTLFNNVCKNAFEVIVKTPVGGQPPISKHRKELKIQGEAEYFLTNFEVF